MEPPIMVSLLGAIIIGAGTIILILGKKKDIELRYFIARSPSRFTADELNEHFNPYCVAIYKVCAYLGPFLFMAGVLMNFFWY